MKIIVFGAAGQVGSRVVAEAGSRGHEVTAVIRKGSQAAVFDPSVHTRVRDVNTGSLADAIDGHDYVVSALRAPNGQEGAIVALTRAVVEPALSLGVPFLVVGGAAPLIVPDSGGHTVLTAPGFLPKNVVPVAQASQAQWDWCAGHLEPNGVHLCPPAMLAPGKRTGTYRTGRDKLVVDGAGNSQISMEDFAVAIIDEAENAEHAGQRFTVGY